MKRLMHYSSAFALTAAICMAPEGTGSVSPAMDAVGLGLSGKTAAVHKANEEGVLMIDAVTGQVIPGQEDRPDWSEGLVLAQLGARHIFYATRLGEEGYTAEMRNPEVYAFEDLDWLALNVDPAENGADDEYVIDASEEHRADVLASAFGIDRETGDIKGVLMETEVASDQTRSEAELAALEETKQDRFAATGTGE